jgi:hypothetical protein
MAVAFNVTTIRNAGFSHGYFAIFFRKNIQQKKRALFRIENQGLEPVVVANK